MTAKLEDEIRHALLDGAPTDDERVAWARAALARSPLPLPRRRGRLLLLAGGLAATLVAGVYVASRPPSPEFLVPDHVDRRRATLDEERAANLRFLEEPAAKEALAAAPAGSWAVVAGRELHVAATAEEALAWTRRSHPDARQAFLVPCGHGFLRRGDVIADRAPVALSSGGLGFLEPTGVKVDGQTVRCGGRAVALDASGELRVDVSGTVIALRLDPESLAPIVLPVGVRFPRQEIPGRTILEDLDRNWRSFRRYCVHVRHLRLGIDTWCEAIGTEDGDPYAPGHWVAVRLGTHVFHALRRSPAEQAAIEGKPLLVLHFAKGTTDYLDRLFGTFELDQGHAQLAVPEAKRTELRRYGRDGRLLESLALPDDGDATRARLRDFLRRS